MTRLLLMMLLALSSATQAAAQVHVGQVLGPAAREIELDVGGGELIRLPRAANTVFVADATVADVNVRSPSLVYLFAKAPGQTTLYAVDEREQIVVAQRVIVAPNLTRLRGMIHQLYPHAPVEVRSVGPNLVLYGSVTDAGAADRLYQLAVAATGDPRFVMNQLTISAPTQVNIRVKIAEVSRDIQKRIGFNWEVLGDVTSRWALGFAVGSDIVRSATGGFVFPNDNIDRVVSSYQSNSVMVDTVIDLMDDEGLITVLAEPNLTAMSGETASFLAGGEFPIPVAQEQGRTTIQFRQFGVGLSFTPTIVADNRINLKVRPEVSQLTTAGAIMANGFEIPALTTRRADTTVELGSGQSFAIAGLLQNTTNSTLSDLPGLKDLPVLGALFRSDAFRRQESELMIIVTPYIVRPVAARIPLPTDGYVPPKDIERFLLGRNHVAQPPAGPSQPLDPMGRPGLAGPAGFVLQ